MKFFKFLLFSAGIFCLNVSWAQTKQTMALVDDRLWESLSTEAQVECLIVMKTQADLGPAKYLRTKAEKGAWVYETLLNVSESTQEPVRAELRAAEVNFQSFWVINALWAKVDAPLLQRLSGMPEIDRIEANPVWHTDLPSGDTAMATERTLVPISWGLSKIKADSVWLMGYTGQNVVMGGQDTGYEWAHPALKSKYRGWNGGIANHSYNWHDAVHGTIGAGANPCGLNLTAPCDDHNHGTHTMGTMLGSPNNDSIIGVAPSAKWIGCRNMDRGDGTPTTYMECFQWFIAPTNIMGNYPNSAYSPDVINNSWGCPTSEGCGPGNYLTMETVVNNVRAAGILVVVSAGNSGSSCSSINTPAAIYNASYTVGATQSSDVIASFSSRGPVTVYNGPLSKPDISAPGVTILSCVGHNNQSSTYKYESSGWSGTSMAAPHVAGVAALVMSANPSLKGDVDGMENLLNATAVPLYSTQTCGGNTGTTRPNNMYGWGRVNAKAAVLAAIALPVEYLRWEAKVEGQEVHLFWQTASESECDHFTVERSTDLSQWTAIGDLACAGNSSSTLDYQFADTKPPTGYVYYRLRQVDWSGKAQYNKALVVRLESNKASLQVVANPGANSMLVNISGTHGMEKVLKIWSADGQLQGTFPVADRAVLYPGNLAQGIYMAVLYDEKENVLSVDKLLWW